MSRLYSADVGRFPQPDSILPDVFGPQALSRYSYVSNNPTNFTDPTGHFGSGVYPVGPMPGGGGGDPVLPPGYDDADSPSVPSQPGGDYLVCEPHGTIMRSLGRADNRSWWVGYGALINCPVILIGEWRMFLDLFATGPWGERSVRPTISEMNCGFSSFCLVDTL